MEYLTTLTAVGKLIAEAIKAGGFAKQREAKLKELENTLKKLRAQINAEGEKIERYIRFDTLVSQIDGGIATISDVNTWVPDAPSFWKAIDSANRVLYTTAQELRVFSSDGLEARYQGLISAHSANVVGKIIGANAILEAKGDRVKYVEALRDASLDLGDLKPVGSNVLADIGQQLRGFGG